MSGLHVAVPAPLNQHAASILERCQLQDPAACPAPARPRARPPDARRAGGRSALALRALSPPLALMTAQETALSGAFRNAHQARARVKRPPMALPCNAHRGPGAQVYLVRLLYAAAVRLMPSLEVSCTLR